MLLGLLLTVSYLYVGATVEVVEPLPIIYEMEVISVDQGRPDGR